MQAPNTTGNNGNGCLQSQHRMLHRIRTARSVIYTHNKQAIQFGSLSPLSPGGEQEKKTNENHQRSDNDSKRQGHVCVSSRPTNIRAACQTMTRSCATEKKSPGKHSIGKTHDGYVEKRDVAHAIIIEATTTPLTKVRVRCGRR